MWRWQTSRKLLLVAAAITVIVSLFEMRLDALGMLREIVSNFITCVSITIVTATLVAVFRDVRLPRDPVRLVSVLLLLALGGILGGLISWGINDLLFPYRITHPHFYLLTVALLAVIFGLALFAYESISLKLDETAEKLAAKEVQEQKLLRARTEAELEALRAKVNPHFLFNTLNSIASLIPVDPIRAEEMVQRLSNLFRYVLSVSERSLMPLGDELDIVREYLEIEQVRLTERLHFSIERDESVDTVRVPGMLLQPLVENGVKHGIATRTTGGHITIRSWRDGDRCRIAIEDSGPGFDVERIEEGFGISGVRQRLELHYPGTHEFSITMASGARIQIGIPIQHALSDRSR